MLSAWHPLREIDRPYVGLHSLDQAHNAWLARTHVVHGLDYTHGFPTFAVGDPPEEVPRRYLDHPVLYALADAAAMGLLGVDVRTLRATNVLATIVALLLLMRILRHLADDVTALVAGLVIAQLPLITYFGFNQWLYVLCFSAFWCYLVLLRALHDGPAPSRFHLAALSGLLFVAVQLQWEGFFFAMAIGVHWLARCARRREWPGHRLPAAIAVPSLAGLVLNFVILAAGDDWNFGRLAQLFGWRAGSAERDAHEWGAWFVRIWEFGLTNFGGVVLVLAMAWLLVGPLLPRLTTLAGARRFPQFWLFALPAIFQLSILKGVVWEHQWWERPLVPVVGIASALGLLTLCELLGRIRPWLSVVALLVGLGAVSASTWVRTGDYYDVRHYYPERLAMFEQLRRRIPPDQALLSFESYLFDQNPGVKQTSYRPQVGWYLDRPVVVARRIDEILEKARTGRYPLYLMPTTHPKEEIRNYLAWLAGEMSRRYPAHRVPDSPDQWLFELGRPGEAP